MIVSNKDIAAIFDEVADLLELKGDNPFKIRAYKNAARTIENMGTSMSKMVEEGVDLSALPTIGEKIADKIKEIVQTGKLQKLENLKKEFPPHLLDLLSIEGIGPKRTKILYDALDIQSLNDLKKAAENHQIRALEGFDEKLENLILKATQLAKKEGKRFKFADIEPYASDIVTYLKNCKDVLEVEVAGSFRRRKETVGDLDVLTTAKNQKSVIDYFVRYEGVREIVSQGSTRSTVILNNDLQVDLRCVADESYGAALHYFTGSKAHNIAIRKMAIELDMKVNEYGIFKDGKKVAGETELSIYKKVGLCYIEPELRENRGEIEAAKAGKLPKLITLDDIRGDLHMHTTYSDGHNTITEMAEAAKERGYEYIAITDHSKHLAIVHGVDEKRLREEIEEIDRINASLKGITILKSIEVDILEDGTLALPDSILKELDLVVGAVHDHFKLSEQKQTKRIIKAMDNPCFNILAHPTGRLINERAAYAVDMQRLFKEAKERGCFFEINAQPKRLDLNDTYAKAAKEEGLSFSLSTDSHNSASLAYMKYAVYQARRGWVEKKDVLNTLSLSALKKRLQRK